MPRTWTPRGRIAGFLLILVVVLSALTAFLPASTSDSSPSAFQGLASARDPYLWPFTPDSIWNLPIGANAVYVPAHVKQATQAGMTTDPDVLILTPTAPSTAVYENNDGWSGGSRCNPQGPLLFNGPIPSNFVVPGATPSSTPNYATAILMPDNHTLAQGQPMARCTAGNPATMMWYNENEDLYGLGFSGGHGGSMLSSIGGTIRLGELLPGSVIRHALKVNLYGHDDYFYNSSTKGYRWPATTADSYASSVYGGTVAALRMGSLLALPTSLNISSMGLETQPALILAKAFQDYGAYTVDDTGWSVYAIETEFSPNGHVEDEFQNAWGFSMTPSSKSTPWARDMDRIFGNLSVVDNWNKSEWNTISASNGTQGAGGGAPLVPWAPPFGSPPNPTPLTADFTFNPASPETGQTVGFTATASGGTSPYSYAWTFGDGSTGSGASVSHAYGQAGNYTVGLTVRDAASGTANATNVVAVTAPPPPPSQVSVQSPTPGMQVTFGQHVTVSWTSSGSLKADTVSISFSTDGGTTWNPPFATGQPLNGSTTWTAPSMATNEAMMRAVAKDTLGNNVEGRSGQFTIRSPPPPGFPVARLSYTPAWPQPSMAIAFDASASSPAEPNGTLEARWDWQNDGVWDTSWSATMTAQHAYGAEGTVAVRLEVKDSSGTEDNATASLVVDGTPPMTTASVRGILGTGGWYVTNVTVSLAATDALSGVAWTRFRIDGGAWRPYSAPISLGDGQHELDFYSMDWAGMVESTHVLNVHVDRSLPIFHGASPTGVVTTSGVQITWNATDLAATPIRYATSVDGGPFVDRGTDTSLSLVLPDGDHVVVVRATDPRGNSVETAIAFRVDTNPFSFTGPYGGVPTIVALAAIVLVTALALLRRQRRRRTLRMRRLRERARGDQSDRMP